MSVACDMVIRSEQFSSANLLRNEVVMNYNHVDTDGLFDDLSISHAEKIYICHTYDIDGSNRDEISLFATHDGARSHYRKTLIDTLIWSLCNDDFPSIDEAYSHLASLTDEQLYEIWTRGGDADRKLCYHACIVTS